MGIQILAKVVLEKLKDFEKVEGDLLVDALLLSGFVITLLEVGEWAAVQAVSAWASFVHFIAPWFLLFVAVFSGPCHVALVILVARVVLPFRSGTKRSWLNGYTLRTAAAGHGLVRHQDIVL